MSDFKQTPDADALDDARDRLVDRVLSEAIGGETPPDLSASIRERAEARKAEVSGALDPAKRDRALRWLAGIGAVAALLFIAVSLTVSEVGEEPLTVVLLEKSRASALEGARIQKSLEENRQHLGHNVGAVSGLTDQPPVSPDAETWRRMAPAQERVKPVAIPASQSVPLSSNAVPAAPLQRRVREAASASATIGVQNPQVGDLAGVTSDLDLPFRQGSFNVTQPTPPPTANPAPIVMLSDGRIVAGRAEQESSTTATNTDFVNGADTYGRPVQNRRIPDALGLRPLLSTPQEGTNLDVGGAVRSYAALDAIGDLGDLDQDRLKRQLFGFDNGGWTRERSSEQYTAPPENEFTTPVGGDALSTFSCDVDTASYTNTRRFLLRDRQAPPPAAVRIEELVNYFDYGYAAPDAESEDPFAASMEVGACPWKPEHKLVRIGIQGRRVDADKRPLSNLVFLVDVSGSMNSPDKLPLVVAGLEALTDRLGENDRVAIAVYAGSEGLVLPSTSGLKKDEIRSALGRLQAGGSTAGGAGLRMACNVAERNKIPGGVNRVVLCTDGDFNVGLTGTEELAKLVETQARDAGIFLTVLGFGRGNLNDAMLEAISGRGDGHYAYIDSEREARRVLSRDLSGTLVTIAKDVKLQVEFNPAKVASYRLIGYENRVLAAKDFNDDTKDAGEIGAGHTVTALYEIVPVGARKPAPPVDGLKYQSAVGGGQSAVNEGQPEASAPGSNDEPTEFADELLTLKIRYKQPEGGPSKKLEFPLAEGDSTASGDFRWSAAVAEFGLLLRDSRHAGEASLDHVLETAREAIGEDPHGQRAEFLDMVRTAKEVSRQ